MAVLERDRDASFTDEIDRLRVQLNRLAAQARQADDPQARNRITAARSSIAAAQRYMRFGHVEPALLHLDRAFNSANQAAGYLAWMDGYRA